jgi:UDP-galactopyranose mutase
MLKIKNIVVGSGIAGAVIARRLAEEKNEKVLVVERRNYIGGYCYDYRDENGILIHLHGPHIFRTHSEKIWNFLSRFTEWYDYQHKVLANVGGKNYPMPINLDTVNLFLGTHYDSENVEEYFENHRIQIEKVENVRQVIESQIGSTFYHAFFEKYTEKQWGCSCEELPPEVVARIPIRKNRDDRYFEHRYQAMPQNGYTEMIKNLLDHPNISVLLNTDYKDIQDRISFDRMYYSGAIDEYHSYRYGKLPYRCVFFQFETFACEEYQPVAVVNYPNNYNYTRITEFKHFYNQKVSRTVIAKEYPSESGDPSYPIPVFENRKKYELYLAIPAPNVRFIGRLGRYRYYSMDQVVEEVLNMQID